MFGIIYGILFSNGKCSDKSPSILSVSKVKLLFRIIVGAILMLSMALPLYLIPV